MVGVGYRGLLSKKCGFCSPELQTFNDMVDEANQIQPTSLQDEREVATCYVDNWSSAGL